jgi:hypothetical protein
MPNKEKTHEVEWHELNRKFKNLSTGVFHKIIVKREAVPLVFVPGIMGSRLRGAGGDMRWDSGSKKFMLKTYALAKPEKRKKLLIGSQFDPDFLKVADADPVGDGVQGVSAGSYGDFIRRLQTHDWGPLNKLFDFPVYAFGYNWTDTSYNSGRKLAWRIADIINECNKEKRPCRHVILISHSMGGIVCRSASELHGSRDYILGVIHGVQPVTGACAAYWRMKAGFEADGFFNFFKKIASKALGNNGRAVTAALANMPGGLELLPTRDYRANDGSRSWLRIFNKDGREEPALPRLMDPYEEIYRERHAYWRLVDEELLDLSDKEDEDTSDDNDAFDADNDEDVLAQWDNYIELLDMAEKFHNRLGLKKHPRSFCFHGRGHTTADTIRYQISREYDIMDHYQPNASGTSHYQTRGFFHVLSRDKHKLITKSVLQDPTGHGDGTVPISSGGALDRSASSPPDPEAFKIEHEPAYKENDDTFRFTLRAIGRLCQIKLEEHGL